MLCIVGHFVLASSEAFAFCQPVPHSPKDLECKEPSHRPGITQHCYYHFVWVELLEDGCYSTEYIYECVHSDGPYLTGLSNKVTCDSYA